MLGSRFIYRIGTAVTGGELPKPRSERGRPFVAFGPISAWLMMPKQTPETHHLAPLCQLDYPRPSQLWPGPGDVSGPGRRRGQHPLCGLDEFLGRSEPLDRHQGPWLAEVNFQPRQEGRFYREEHQV